MRAPLRTASVVVGDLVCSALEDRARLAASDRESD